MEVARKKLVVVGGGAAGFFCAVNAARLNPNLDVVLLEKNTQYLSKVKISGGGRCNVTHACFDIDTMAKKYPRGERFLRKAFYDFFTTDTIKWFEERGVPLKTESDGRMFPESNTSQTIIDCLVNEAAKYGVKIQLKSEVKEIKSESGGFNLTLSDSSIVRADYLCIASGGYSRAASFDWIIKAGHTIEEPVPSLFTFNSPEHPLTELMGLSVEDAQIKINGTKWVERGPTLVTHWGLSGPAVIRLSSWAAKDLAKVDWNFKASIQWLPDIKEEELRSRLQAIRENNPSQKIKNNNLFHLPQRLWEFLLKFSEITEDTLVASVSGKQLNRLIQNLLRFELPVKGKTTFKEEFVTAGGVKLTEVDSKTMMSRIVPNLFFAGEILDVDGITGGFNFQNAWTTGFIAAKTIAEKASA